MHDRPDMTELIAAARLYLESELLPALTDPRQRFQTLVAAHVLSIVERELPIAESDLRWEVDWLNKVLDESSSPVAAFPDLRQQVLEGNRRLCASIRAGKFDGEEQFARLGHELRETVQRKLRVANPRLATLPLAK